jgi:hypothetical protein
VRGQRLSAAQLAAFEKRRAAMNESSDPLVLLALLLATLTFPVALASWCCNSLCSTEPKSGKIYD